MKSRAHTPLNGGQQISLVNEQKVLLLLGDFFHILLQVCAAEERRVSGIHNLHNNFAPLNDSPQLPPHLQIPLKGREDEPLIVFLQAVYSRKKSQRVRKPPQSRQRRQKEDLASSRLHWRKFSRSFWSSSSAVVTPRFHLGLLGILRNCQLPSILALLASSSSANDLV